MNTKQFTEGLQPVESKIRGRLISITKQGSTLLFLFLYHYPLLRHNLPEHKLLKSANLFRFSNGHYGLSAGDFNGLRVYSTT
jgi:hypothetical protein